jgi:excisionase family DNA binding protein
MSELLTKREAATRARITERTLDRHIAAGSGPTLVRIGRRVLIRAEDIRNWIDDHAVIAPPPPRSVREPAAATA